MLASRSAIAGAVNALENLGLIRRSRAAGERMDRVRIDINGTPTRWGSTSLSTGSRATSPAKAWRCWPTPRSSGGRYCWSWAAFADFLVERLPVLEQEWKAHREALRAAGQLPADPFHSHRKDEEG